MKYLVICLVYFLFISSVNTDVDKNRSELIKNKIGKYVVSMKKLLESRRKNIYTQKLENGALTVNSISSIETSSVQWSNVLTCSTISELDRALLFWCDNKECSLAEFNHTTSNLYHLMKISNNNLIPIKSRYFKFGTYGRHFVVLYKDKIKPIWSIAIYKQNKSIGDEIKTETYLVRDEKMDIDVIMREDNIYMAVSINQGLSNKSALRLYIWAGTQFDLLADTSLESINLFSSIRLFASSSQVYIAITTTEKGSALFSYYPGYHTLSRRQFFPDIKATKVEHFNIRNNDYLIFIGPNEAKIFWMFLDRLVEYQSIPKTENASDVSVVELRNKEALISLLVKNELRFFIAPDGSDYIQTIKVSIPNVYISGIHFFSIHLEPYIVFSYWSKKSFNPIYKIKLKPYEYSKDHDPLKECIQKAFKLLDEKRLKLNEISEKFSRVWLTNKNQVVHSPIYVYGKVFIKKDASVNHIELTTNSQLSTNITNSEIKSRLSTVNSSLAHIMNVLENNVVRKDRPGQIIYGRVDFTQQIKLESVTFGKIANSPVINGIPFNYLRDNALSIVKDQKITGKWSIDTLEANQITLNGRLNDLHLSDILLKNSSTIQNVLGTLSFNDVQFRKKVAVKSINGIDIKDFITTSNLKTQFISGEKIFEKVNAHSNIKVEILNGRNLSSLFSQIVRIDSLNETFLGNLTFNELYLDNFKVKTINTYINVEKLLKDAVTYDYNQLITGLKTFTNITARSIHVSGKINGLDINSDLVTTNTLLPIRGKLIFEAPVTIESDFQTDKINDISLDDIVLKNSQNSQIITGFKTFTNTLYVQGNITMDPGTLLNEVNLSKLNKDFKSLNFTYLSLPLYINNLKINGNLTILGTVNGHNFTKFTSDLIFTNKYQDINLPLKLNKLNVNNLITDKLNKFKIPDDFVLKNSKDIQVIKGNKYFSDLSVEGQLEIIKGTLVNNINLHQLQNEIISSTDSIDLCKGRKIFDKVVVTGNVIANILNGYDLKKFFLANLNQTISSNVSVKASRLETINLLVDGNVDVLKINNRNVKEWIDDLVLDNTFVVLRNKNFKEIHIDTLLADGKINGVHLNTWLSSVVKLDTSQEIKSHLIFSDVEFRGNLQLDKLNGATFAGRLGNLVFKRHPNQVISGMKTINGDVTVKGIMSLDLIKMNEKFINLKEILANSASKTQTNIFTYPAKFETLEIDNLFLGSKAKLGNISLDDIVFLDKHENIDSHLIFLNDIVIHKALYYYSDFVDECDLSRLYKQSIRKSRSVQKLLSSGFNILEIMQNISLTSNINFRSIDKWSSQLIPISANNEVDTSLTFNDEVTVDHLITRGNLGSVDFNYLFNDCVRKSIPQTIYGYKTFKKDVTIHKNLILTGPVTVNGKVAGVKLDNLNQTSLRDDSNIIFSDITTIPKAVFKRNVHINDTLGSLKIKNLVESRKEADIEHPIYFGPTYIRTNIHIYGNLNGLNFSDLLSRLISLRTNGIIVNELIFLDTLTVDNLKINKAINNIPVRSIMTKNGTHFIKAKYTISGSVIVDKIGLSPQGYVDGINLQELKSKVVDISKPQTILGKMVFKEAHFKKGVSMPRTINGLTTHQIHNLLKNYTQKAKSSETEMDSRLKMQKHRLNEYYRQTFHQSPQLDYFEIFYQMPFDESDSQVLISRFLTTSEARKSDYVTNNRFGPIPNIIIAWRLMSSKPCPNYQSLVYLIENSGYFKQISTYDNRIFPSVKNPLNQMWFSTWNKATCKQNSYAQILISTNKVDFFQRKRGLDTEDLTQVLSMPHSEELVKFGNWIKNTVYFHDRQGFYTLIALERSIGLYQYNQVLRKWLIIQEFSIGNISSMDIINYTPIDKIFLVVSIKMSQENKASNAVLYSWNKLRKKFEIIQTLNSFFTSSVKFIPTADNKELFLVIANEKYQLPISDCLDDTVTSKDDNSGAYHTAPLDVYRLSSSMKMKLVQSLPYEGINTLDTFHLATDSTFLVAGSKFSGKTYIFRLQGYSYFQEIFRFSTPGVEDINAYWSKSGNLFLAIASSIPGESLILKASLSGPSLTQDISNFYS